MFLGVSLEPELLRGADRRMHRTLRQDRGDRLGREQIQVEATRAGVPVGCCSMHRDLRHLGALDTLGLLERQ